MNTIMWSCDLVDLSKSLDEFQGCRHMNTIGLKMVWEPKKFYQGDSVPWIIWSRKFFFWKKVIAVVLRSTIMSKWELEAILQLLQVMERSKSSKIFDKSSSIQGPLQKSKIKMQNIYLWIVFCQNAFWNQKTLRTRSGHPCTVSAIFPWQWQVSFNGLGISYRDRQIHKPQVPRK